MGRHGVPYRTRSKFGKSHLQLVCTAVFHSFQNIFYNQLVYDTVVAVFHFSVMVGNAQSIFFRIGLLKFGIGCNQLSNVRFVSRSRVDIEFGRVGSIVALESYFFIATTYIKSFFILHGVFFTVYGNYSIATGVDNTQLATFEEVSDFRTQLTESLQFQYFVYRHCTSVNQTVIEGVSNIDFVRSHYFAHHKRATETLCVIMLYVQWMAGCLHSVIYLGGSRNCGCTQHQGNC